MRKGSSGGKEYFDGHHRREHWYRNNSVYFITARCNGKFRAFASEPAKAVFWAKLAQYANQYGFIVIVATLMDNHYHLLGYLQMGDNLGPLMQRLHGSVAKLVNDTLAVRLRPFWRERGTDDDYFDGCIRDDRQFRRCYRYVLLQSVRHGIVSDYRSYPHARTDRVGTGAPTGPGEEGIPTPRAVPKIRALTYTRGPTASAGGNPTPPAEADGPRTLRSAARRPTTGGNAPGSPPGNPPASPRGPRGR
jgi:REP element-mobilizing transposase RayT